jgi:hypothetical protein
VSESQNENNAELENALKIAVRAAANAEQYARNIGYGVRFSSEDIRELALAVFSSAVFSSPPKERDSCSLTPGKSRPTY